MSVCCVDVVKTKYFPFVQARLHQALRHFRTVLSESPIIWIFTNFIDEIWMLLGHAPSKKVEGDKVQVTNFVECPRKVSNSQRLQRYSSAEMRSDFDFDNSAFHFCRYYPLISISTSDLNSPDISAATAHPSTDERFSSPEVDDRHYPNPCAGFVPDVCD